MDLSIIIINWNSANLLRECLRSIYQHTAGLTFEIIVLDNASYDGCGELLKSQFPNVVFIQSEENLGFSRGNNYAASQSNGDVLLFLNPDTLIQGPSLEILHRSILSLPRAGIVGARLMNGDGTIQTSCIQKFPTIINQLIGADLLIKMSPSSRLWGILPLFSGSDAPKEVEGISGACLMTRRDVFEQVGGFTEDYFMYYEDMDYCLKARNGAWSAYFIPTAIVTHYGGKSSGGETNSHFSVEMMAESAWRYFRSQRGLHYAHLFRMGLAANAVLRFYLLVFARIVTSSESRHRRIMSALGKWTQVLRWCLDGIPFCRDKICNSRTR